MLEADNLDPKIHIARPVNFAPKTRSSTGSLQLMDSIYFAD